MQLPDKTARQLCDELKITPHRAAFGCYADVMSVADAAAALAG